MQSSSKDLIINQLQSEIAALNAQARSYSILKQQMSEIESSCRLTEDEKAYFEDSTSK